MANLVPLLILGIMLWAGGVGCRRHQPGKQTNPKIVANLETKHDRPASTLNIYRVEYADQSSRRKLVRQIEIKNSYLCPQAVPNLFDPNLREAMTTPLMAFKPCEQPNSEWTQWSLLDSKHPYIIIIGAMPAEGQKAVDASAIVLVTSHHLGSTTLTEGFMPESKLALACGQIETKGNRLIAIDDDCDIEGHEKLNWQFLSPWLNLSLAENKPGFKLGNKGTTPQKRNQDLTNGPGSPGGVPDSSQASPRKVIPQLTLRLDGQGGQGVKLAVTPTTRAEVKPIVSTDERAKVASEALRSLKKSLQSSTDQSPDGQPDSLLAEGGEATVYGSGDFVFRLPKSPNLTNLKTAAANFVLASMLGETAFGPKALVFDPDGASAFMNGGEAIGDAKSPTIRLSLAQTYAMTADVTTGLLHLLSFEPAKVPLAAGIESYPSKGTGFVHGDLSPNNILVAKDGSYQLIDLSVDHYVGKAFDQDAKATAGFEPAYSGFPQLLPANASVLSLGQILKRTGHPELEPLISKMTPKDASKMLTLAQVLIAVWQQLTPERQDRLRSSINGMSDQAKANLKTRDPHFNALVSILKSQTGPYYTTP